MSRPLYAHIDHTHYYFANFNFVDGPTIRLIITVYGRPGVEEEASVAAVRKSRSLHSTSLSPASSPIAGRSGHKRRKN